MYYYSCFNVCFRYANGAGHSYGPFELNVKYELYGSLHETRSPLAETGQRKGEVTNLLPLVDASGCLLVSHCGGMMAT